MSIAIVVSSFQGIVEDPIAFNKLDDAYAYVIKEYGKQGEDYVNLSKAIDVSLSFSEYNNELDLIASELKDEYDEKYGYDASDHEIHIFHPIEIL